MQEKRPLGIVALQHKEARPPIPPAAVEQKVLGPSAAVLTLTDSLK